MDRNIDYCHDVISGFKLIAKEHPDKLALICGNHQQMTYEELEKRSNRLSCYLSQCGIRENSLVLICIERRIEMIVGIIAILKLGASYIPIDPSYPSDRHRYIIGDCKATFAIVSDKTKILLMPYEALKLINIDEFEKEHFITGTINKRISDHSQLAYILYTSGSTGCPKGVMIERRNLNSFIRWCEKEFSFDTIETVYFSTSLCFDLSVFEIFYPLTTGKTIRIIENTIDICRYVLVDRYVLLNTVPSVISELFELNINTTRLSVVNVAGEPISKKLQQRLHMEKFVARNLYGPTETTVYCTCHKFVANKPATIGRPIDGINICLVGKLGIITNVDDIGEIYISGDTVGRGYINNPNLSAEKFIVSENSSTAKMYKTGDLGRWTSEGEIDFVGRVDDQVKIRGFRIELGEIESVLQSMDSVRNAKVLAIENARAEKILIAFVSLSGNSSAKGILHQLRKKLPEYMVPTQVLQIDEFPITVNGKIDRKKLELIATTSKEGLKRPPKTQTEIKLWLSWKKMFQMDHIGIDDNFFSLGGHSLMALHVAAIIQNEFQIFASITDVLDFGTIRKLAFFLDTVSMNTKNLPTNNCKETISFTKPTVAGSNVDDYKVVKLINFLNKKGLQVRSHDNLQLIVNANNEKPDPNLLDKFLTDSASLFQFLKKHPCMNGLVNFNNLNNNLEQASRLFKITPTQTYWVDANIDAEFKTADAIHGAIIIAFEIQGNMSYDTMEQAIFFVINRHESLRSIFVKHRNEYLLRVLPMNAAFFKPCFIDLERNFAVEEYHSLVSHRNHKFDLETGPLFISKIMKTGIKQYCVSLKIHHSICDGVSVAIIKRDLLTAYHALSENRRPELPNLPFQYKEILNLTANYMKENRTVHRNFWIKEFSYLPKKICLPELQNCVPCKSISNQIKKKCYSLPRSMSDTIYDLTRNYTSNFFIILQTLVKAFLAVMSQEFDITVGTDINGRQFPGSANIVGCFAKTVIIRTIFEPHDTFDIAVTKVLEANKKMMDYDSFTLLDLIEQINATPNKALWDFNIQYRDLNAEKVYEASIPNLKFNEIKIVDNSIMTIDMQLEFIKDGSELFVEIEFDSGKFSTAYIDHFTSKLIDFSLQFMNNKSRSLSSFFENKGRVYLTHYNM